MSTIHETKAAAFSAGANVEPKQSFVEVHSSRLRWRYGNHFEEIDTDSSHTGPFLAGEELYRLFEDNSIYVQFGFDLPTGPRKFETLVREIENRQKEGRQLPPAIRELLGYVAYKATRWSKKEVAAARRLLATKGESAYLHMTAEARLEWLEDWIVETYTRWIDPDKGEGGTCVSIETMLQQIDEVLEHNLS